MMQTFPEWTIGGVLIAPFVLYAGAAVLVFLLLRPFLNLVGFHNLFSHPPVTQISLYVLILATLIVFL